jgi:lipopolysaccharide biosynthesis glycosyltransferase
MEQRFVSLLKERRFTVAQDQDYLNLLCRGLVHFFDSAWNHTAVRGALNDGKPPKIVHYKMDWKPWHADGVLFEELFWHYADASAFAEEIRAVKAAYTDGQRERDRLARERLAETAYRETEALLYETALPIWGEPCALRV